MELDFDEINLKHNRFGLTSTRDKPIPLASLYLTLNLELLGAKVVTPIKISLFRQFSLELPPSK